jgi:hypothetical protein
MIKDILLEKAKQKKLAHFYIVESSLPLEEAQEQLMNFVHEFIRDYYHKVENQKQSLTHLMDHPDVVVLGYSSEDKKEAAFYSVAEAETLTRFFEWRAVQSQRKFAIIPDAHRINMIVANKWLKLLEEPPLEATIFLLNPKKTKLLDTIHSRALHLRLPTKREEVSVENWKALLADAKSMPLSQFLENYSKGEIPLSEWVTELLNWEGGQSSTPEAKQSLMTWVKNYEEMEIFHQPHATKWALFYSHLKEHVLPRL